MNPNGQGGPQFTRPLTKEALDKEFVIKLKREHILVINNMFATRADYNLGDAKKILELLEHFKDALVLTDKDFVPLPKPPESPAPPVQGAGPANGIKV